MACFIEIGWFMIIGIQTIGPPPKRVPCFVGNTKMSCNPPKKYYNKVEFIILLIIGGFFTCSIMYLDYVQINNILEGKTTFQRYRKHKS